jgi:alkaline phosphatase D
VLSVPAIHLPKAITKLAARMTHAGEDFSDRWSTGSHIRDRDRLFRLIHDHQTRRPDRKIVLLSGDIHLGCAQKIRWGDGAAPFYQLISSGITHSLGHTMQIAAKLLMRLNRNFSTRDGTLAGHVNFLQGKGHFTRNPYGGMNVGIVEVENDAGESGPHLRFSLYGHRGERPFREFRSVAF